MKPTAPFLDENVDEGIFDGEEEMDVETVNHNLGYYLSYLENTCIGKVSFYCIIGFNMICNLVISQINPRTNNRGRPKFSIVFGTSMLAFSDTLIQPPTGVRV